MTMVGMIRRLAGTLLLLSDLTTSVMLDQSPIVQTAKTKITARGTSYYWPEAGGHPEAYSVSSFTAPRNLSNSLAWKYTIKSENSVPYGIVMDDIGHIFLASTDGIRMFDSAGKLLWQHPLSTSRIPCLADGTLYVTDNEGNLLALKMQTGGILWSRKFAALLGNDISGIGVSDGVVVAESQNPQKGGVVSYVAGLDASDGGILWEHQVDAELRNFMPMFTDYGTVVFQDISGAIYHLHVASGSRIWKVGNDDNSTHSMTTYGNNDIVYSVYTKIVSQITDTDLQQTSDVRAYSLRDGHLLWQQNFPYPANSHPLVGFLGKGVDVSTRLSLIVPIGAQLPGGSAAFGGGFLVFDAVTGDRQWNWIPSVDDARKWEFGTCHQRPHFGSPSIDAKGTLYLGHVDGMFYAIRDDNGDNIIDGQTEVSSFNTQAGFLYGGTAIGLRTLATASCDTLYVFKE